MTRMSSFWMIVVFLIIAALNNQVSFTKATEIGVCYGMNGDNLPSPSDTIALYKNNSIERIRLFEPVPKVLEALRGKQIDVALGVRNDDTFFLSKSPEATLAWFHINIEPYLQDITFEYIVVGNEMVPGEYSQYIVPTMINFQYILDTKHLEGITVTTAVGIGGVLEASFPPSSGAFADNSRPVMNMILEFLSAQGSPLMVNLYPYFAFASDPTNIPLEYAQFTSSKPVVEDNGLKYYNLLDAMVDAFFSAMERENKADVSIMISESGWPSAGNGIYTSPDLASTYNTNFMNHLRLMPGTPKRPGVYIEGYLFAMFEENLKSPPGVENHFGLFYPNMQPVYHVFNHIQY